MSTGSSPTVLTRNSSKTKETSTVITPTKDVKYIKESTGTGVENAKPMSQEKKHSTEGCNCVGCKNLFVDSSKCIEWDFCHEWECLRRMWSNERIV